MKAKKLAENQTNNFHKRLKSAMDLRINNEGITDFSHSPKLKERSNSNDNILEQLLHLKLSDKFKNKALEFKNQKESSPLLFAADECVSQMSCGSLHTMILTSKNLLMIIRQKPPLLLRFRRLVRTWPRR